jgi:chromosome partitioning protein
MGPEVDGGAGTVPPLAGKPRKDKVTSMPPKTPAKPRLTIAVLNQKGGVGKTTLSINLGAAAHLAGRRTLILDLDAQGSAIDWSAAREGASKLDGLAVARADKALNLKRFEELTAGFDVAILDGPPRLSNITQAAAVAADVVLVPLRPGVFDWWACSETLSLLEAADDTRAVIGRGPVRRMFVLNAADERTRMAKSAQEALAKLGEVAPVTIAPRVAFAESASAGESVLTLAADGPAAADVRKLWEALSAEGKRDA